MHKNNERGLVLSGTALLLVLPAMLIATTFFVAVKTGEEGTSIQSLSERASYVAYDMKETIKGLKDAGMRFDNYILNELAENYEKTTIFTNIKIETAPFDIWENVHYGGDYVLHANSEFCEVKNLGPGKWQYSFEDLKSGTDFDYNEPLITLESLDNGDWKVKIEMYSGGATVDLYWGDKLLWSGVNEGSAEEHKDPFGGQHVGDSKIISGVPPSAFVTIVLEDPARNVHYEENFQID